MEVTGQPVAADTEASTNIWCHAAAMMRIQQALSHPTHASTCNSFSAIGLLTLALAFPLSVTMFGCIYEGGEFMLRREQVVPPGMSLQDLKLAFTGAAAGPKL